MNIYVDLGVFLTSVCVCAAEKRNCIFIYAHIYIYTLWIPSAVLDSDWAGRPLLDTVDTQVHSQNKLENHRFLIMPYFRINTPMYPKLTL